MMSLLPRAALAWTAVALVGAGCISRMDRSDQTGTYPIGIYAVHQPEALAELAELGFSHVMGSASEQYLDAAQRAGLHVVAAPGTTADTKAFDDRRAAEVVRRFDRHPALAAWYLSDEPDMHRVPPSRIGAAHAAVRGAGAGKPTALVLFQGREAQSYAGITDWLMVDRYPVPWLPLADFPKHLRLGRLAAGRKQPLLAVLQAFDWATYPEHLRLQVPHRPPTHAELRAMAYLALLEGVQGLFFYCYDDSRWRIRDHPETWAALKQVVAEVRSREPLFLSRPLWRDFEVRYARGEASRNEALDPVIQAGRVRVRRGTASVPSGDYVVAVNTVDREVTWSLGWPGSREPNLPVLDAGRGVGGMESVPGKDGWFTGTFEAYGVRVWGPLPPGR